MCEYANICNIRTRSYVTMTVMTKYHNLTSYRIFEEWRDHTVFSYACSDRWSSIPHELWQKFIPYGLLRHNNTMITVILGHHVLVFEAKRHKHRWQGTFLGTVQKWARTCVQCSEWRVQLATVQRWSRCPLMATLFALTKENTAKRMVLRRL